MLPCLSTRFNEIETVMEYLPSMLTKLSAAQPFPGQRFVRSSAATNSREGTTVDRFEPAPEVVPTLSPGALRRQEIRQAIGRMVRGSVESRHVELMVDGLAPYGPKLLNRLADHGLTIVTPNEGWAHYSVDTRQITFPKGDLERDQEVPFREYMLVHEMAHAMDYLLDPSAPPLSERADLGISTHRTRLHSIYQPALDRFKTIERERRAQGTWGSPPRAPQSRVYGEDYMTVVEAVTGTRLSERPARGHISILEPATKPTEYFADAVYTYLHSDPVTVHRYSLPDGQPIAHSYPPRREDLRARDPRMFAALERFFRDPNHSASSLRID